MPCSRCSSQPRDPGIEPASLISSALAEGFFTTSATNKKVTLVVKEFACQCRRCKRSRFYPWVGKISWKKKWHPTPLFLPGKIQWAEEPGGVGRADYSPWGHKWAQLSNWAHSTFNCTLLMSPDILFICLPFIYLLIEHPFINYSFIYLLIHLSIFDWSLFVKFFFLIFTMLCWFLPYNNANQP